MTIPITAKVVEVPPPERPDLWVRISKNRSAKGVFTMPEAAQMPCDTGHHWAFFLPGTRTLAAQAAERVRVLAGLKELADRDLDKRFLTAPERNMVTAAIAYIEGNKP